jgi:hypothetical protein
MNEPIDWVSGHKTAKGQAWLHPGATESELKERNGLRREWGIKGEEEAGIRGAIG